ncbi:MAG TPA: serine/threonine protein kinase [Leucothrix mucor]|nr:serine/threonine protein kinase [Leucothrix mucor]
MSNESKQVGSFEEVELLFDGATQLEAQEQLAYLQATASSKLIITEVLELLQAHNSLGGFLTKPLKIDDLQAPICPDLTERRVGVWQVDHLIGQGGMGRVYLAHRADGEYEQKVAFKVVEFKSFDNESFFKERQILADLDHPNIVSLFDAGTLEEGFPYLVMEYIDGTPLDKYVRQQQNISQQQLIILFLNLCKVVQSAHGHGIIHCDLKPSNILVTQDGVLKLLDFGIAQSLLALNSDKDNKNKKLFSFTPEYSSASRHQQKSPNVQDDIFSLGVIFAQILTGKAPYTKKTSDYAQPDTKKIAVEIDDELRQIFSSSVGEGDKGNKLRYSFLQELIDDLGWYLDKLPIKAMGDGFSYRAKKNLQRNWMLWLSGSLIFLLLVAAGMSSWQTQKTEQKIDLIRNMSSGLIVYVNDSLSKIPQTTPTRKLLIESVVRQLESFSQQMPGDLEMSILLADNYKKLGVVTGSPFLLSLGDTQSSRGLYDKALVLYNDILPQVDDPLLIHNKINDVKREIGKLYAFQKDIPNMKKLLLEMRLEMEAIYRKLPLSKQHALAVTYIAEAHAEMHLDNFTHSQALLNQAKQILQALGKVEHTERYWIETRFVEEETANILLLKNKPNAAEIIYKSLLKKTPKLSHWRIDRANARVNMALACIYFKKNNRDDALEYFSQAFSRFKSLSEKYPSVLSLKKTTQRYAVFNKAVVDTMGNEHLSKQLQCHHPQSFMMPLNDG